MCIRDSHTPPSLWRQAMQSSFELILVIFACTLEVLLPACCYADVVLATGLFQHRCIEKVEEKIQCTWGLGQAGYFYHEVNVTKIQTKAHCSLLLYISYYLVTEIGNSEVIYRAKC